MTRNVLECGINYFWWGDSIYYTLNSRLPSFQWVVQMVEVGKWPLLPQVFLKKSFQGFEPRSRRIPGWCSTTELTTQTNPPLFPKYLLYSLCHPTWVNVGKGISTIFRLTFLGLFLDVSGVFAVPLELTLKREFPPSLRHHSCTKTHYYRPGDILGVHPIVGWGCIKLTYLWETWACSSGVLLPWVLPSEQHSNNNSTLFQESLQSKVSAVVVVVDEQVSLNKSAFGSFEVNVSSSSTVHAGENFYTWRFTISLLRQLAAGQVGCPWVGAGRWQPYTKDPLHKLLNTCNF